MTGIQREGEIWACKNMKDAREGREKNLPPTPIALGASYSPSPSTLKACHAARLQIKRCFKFVLIGSAVSKHNPQGQQRCTWTLQSFQGLRRKGEGIITSYGIIEAWVVENLGNSKGNGRGGGGSTIMPPVVIRTCMDIFGNHAMELIQREMLVK